MATRAARPAAATTRAELCETVPAALDPPCARVGSVSLAVADLRGSELTCEDEGALPEAVAVPDDEPDEAERLVTLAILDEADAEISETLYDDKDSVRSTVRVRGTGCERTGTRRPSSSSR